MNSKLARWCDGLLEVSWLAAIVLIPLFFNIHSDRVFEPDKLTLLRSLAVFMLALWAIKFIDQRGWERLNWLRWRDKGSLWRMPFVLPIVLIVIVYFLSTLFSVTPSVSWAGSYQRLQGTYSTLAYITIFALMVATIRERPQLDRIITTVIITSIPVSLYAMLQHFGLDPLPWGGETQLRVAGHMGNAIFVAAYLILVVPFTLARILDAFTHILSDEDLDVADVIRSSIYIFTVAIQLIAIYWTSSRGPTVGLGVSIFAFVLILLVALRNASLDKGRLSLRDIAVALLYVFVGILAGFMLLQAIVGALSGRIESIAGAMGSFTAFVAAIGLNVLGIFVLMAARRGWRWLWMAWILVAVFVAGWLTLFNVADEIAAANPPTSLLGRTSTALAEWQQLPAVGRFGQMLDTESRTAKVRVWIWQGALDLITPHQPLAFPDGTDDPFNFLRPLIGYGPESMYVAYNGFYIPELATIEARNASPDRSHNETFDALVITGLAGFLAWQFLYLSIFYYGFRWLGVVRTAFERNLLLGLWFLMGAVLTAIFVSWQGPEFFGVAFPFGNITGLVLYLIYYALFARAQESQENSNPFHIDRLLMIALVSAVLGHFVEIHFGIAIAATRLHFFVFAGLMFMLGYRLHQIGEETVFEETHTVTPEEVQPEEISGRKPGRRRVIKSTPTRPADIGWLTPMATVTFIMALIVGTMGFEFMNFIAAPGEQIQSVEDIPAAAEILRRALFINPDQGFTESPYIFLIIIFSWVLGALIGFSEMIKQGLITPPTPAAKLKPDRQRVAAFIFGGLFVLSFVVYIVQRTTALTGSSSQALGQGLLLMGGGLSLWGMLSLLLNQPRAQFIGTAIAFAGYLMIVPLLVAGSALAALTLLVVCGVLLYLLWDKNWQGFFVPIIALSLFSLVLGLVVSYLQATQLHFAFYAPAGVEQLTEVQRRIIEAENSTNFLDLFYTFVFSTLLLFGTAVAYDKMGRGRELASTPGALSLVLLIPLAFVVINLTNVRVIHADIIYKRARPWDTAAIRERNPDYWDNSIGIYQRAIELTPNEDFYYLWLGRAYLEKSGLIQETAERDTLLGIAEAELKAAQAINPLNTDHTANLARLYARWAGTLARHASRTPRPSRRLLRRCPGLQSAKCRHPQRIWPAGLILRTMIANEHWTFSGFHPGRPVLCGNPQRLNPNLLFLRRFVE
ncbi:MAG: O-antigen ligase family protein [Chloroflexi bacterium]|nr:O-antigen ligase family protein [Chloroflexota bacterium]